MGKVVCEICNKKCKGGVLRVSDKYFHKGCFRCGKCNKSLESGGFFAKEGIYYCPEDYKRHFAVKCRICGNQIEGEVVSALNSSFHRECFHCQDCRALFTTGDRVTMLTDRFYCMECVSKRQDKENQAPVSPKSFPNPTPSTNSTGSHLAPQSVTHCGSNGTRSILSSSGVSTEDESVGYSSSGRPSPSRTQSCPRGVLVNGGRHDVLTDKGYTSTDSAALKSRTTPAPYAASPSPCFSASSGDTLQSSRQSRSRNKIEFGKFLNHSYLQLSERHATSEKDQYKRAASVLNVQPRNQHFHVPAAHYSFRNTQSVIKKGQSLPSMKVLANNYTGHRSVVIPHPRTPPRSSSPETEDAIRNATYPNASQEDRLRQRPIDRDDFPAPASTCVVLAERMRQKRRSGERQSVDQFSIDTSIDSRLDTLDGGTVSDSSTLNGGEYSGMAKAILVGESRRKQHQVEYVDPVSASRTPAANQEPPLKTRFDNHHFVSPSRDTLRDRSERHHLGYSLDYVNIGNRTSNIQSSCTSFSSRGDLRGSVVSNNFSAPRPGYTQAVHLDSNSRSLPMSSLQSGWPLGRARSEDLNQLLAGSIVSMSIDGAHSVTGPSRSDSHQNGLSNGTSEHGRRSHRYRSRERNSPSDFSYPAVHYMGNPSAAFRQKSAPPPPKILPYEQLKLENNGPALKGLDRNKLEDYLSEEDFYLVFDMSRSAFYHLPEWKRNDLKRRVQLF